MAAKSVFEQNVRAYQSLHFSEDPPPVVEIFNGQHGSYRVMAATQDDDYELHVEKPADNATLDIAAVGNVITVSLVTVASVSSTTVADLVDALNDSATYPALDGKIAGASLVNFDGVNAGTTLISAAFTASFYNEGFVPLSVDHTGYAEALVIIDVGKIDFGVSVALSLQHSHDDSVWVALSTDLMTLTHSSGDSTYVGLLRFNHGTTNFRRYLRFSPVITGASATNKTAQVSVMFLLAGGQYFDAESASFMWFTL